MVVRRLVGVVLEHLVGDRDLEPVAQVLEVVQGELLHLVRRVAPREVLPEEVALDRVGEDDRRHAGGLRGGLVGGVHLRVVVTATGETPYLVVGPTLDHLGRARVPAEEVLTDVGAVVGLEGLEVAVGRGVHEVDQRAVAVRREQRVPAAAPDDLDDVPAGAAELCFELLDDLAVAAHGAVELLQVAVHDEREVVELLAPGDADRAERLGLAHLAVAQERPHVLVAGVLDAAVVQVPVEARLVDRVDRREAHRDRRELPVVAHQPRVRVRGETFAGALRVLLPEVVEAVLVEAALEERPCVDAGCGMTLVVDVVAAAGVVLAAEEVVEADLVEAGRRLVGRDVAADAEAGAVRARDHDRGVPADVGADASLDVLVAGEVGLALGGNGVDEVGAAQRRHADGLLTRALQHPQHDVAGAVSTPLVDHLVERAEPVLRLVGIDVRQLGGHALVDDGAIGAG